MGGAPQSGRGIDSSRRLLARQEGGQALLIVLVLVAFLGLVGSGLTAAWLRSVIITQRRADEAAALYAAEAGIAEGAKQLAALGGQAFSGHQDTVGTPPNTAKFTVSASPDGQGGFLLTSRGEKGAAVRVVRVRLASPFLFPFYAARHLDLDAEVWLGKTDVYFDSAPGYGTSPGSSYTIDGDFYLAGTSSRLVPVQVPVAPPTIPFAPFGSLAGPAPDDPPPLPESGGTLTNGWYKAPDGCDWQKIFIPDGVTVGIQGNISCRRNNRVLEVGQNATLVLTGDLSLSGKWNPDVVVIDDGARLVVGGDVHLSLIHVLGQASPVQGKGLLVAGGNVTIQKIGLAEGSTGTNSLAILALDRGSCSGAACGPDSGNNITINDISFLLGSASLDLVAYAGPLQGVTNDPEVALNLGSFFALGTTRVTAAVASAGDVSFSASSAIGWNTIEVAPNPRGFMTFSSLVPGAGLWTQLSWDESGS